MYFAYRYDISGRPTSFFLGGAVVSKTPLFCSGRCTSSNYCFNWSLTSRVCDYDCIFYHSGSGDISSCLTHLNHILSCWANWCWSPLVLNLRLSTTMFSLGDQYFRAASGVGFSWKGLKKLCGFMSWLKTRWLLIQAASYFQKLKPIFVAVEQEAHEHQPHQRSQFTMFLKYKPHTSRKLFRKNIIGVSLVFRHNEARRFGTWSGGGNSPLEDAGIILPKWPKPLS